MRNSYTFEYAYNIAKQYTSLSDFKNSYYNLYIACYMHDWLKQFTWLQRVNRLKWTYETIYQEAQKYTTLKEFRTSVHKAYTIASKNGWLKDYTWLHKNSQNINDSIWAVYVYEIENQYVYVGLTIDINRRDYEHKHRDNDSLYNFCNEHNIDITNYNIKIIQDNINAQEAQQLEHSTIEHYKLNTSYKVINKGKTGIGTSSLGSGILKWDEANCQAVAKTCYTKKEFKHKYSRAYQVARLNNWINNYTWFISSKSYPIVQFTLDGKFVKFYQYGISQVKEETDFNIHVIKNNLKSCTKNKSAHGFIWKRITDIEEIKKYINDKLSN